MGRVIAVPDRLHFPTSQVLDAFRQESEQAAHALRGSSPSSQWTMMEMARLWPERLDRDKSVSEIFSDELTGYMPPIGSIDRSAIARKTVREMQAVFSLEALLEQANPFDDFRSIVSHAHEGTSDYDHKIRTTPIRVLPDALGNSIDFPPPGAVPALLDRLADAVGEVATADPVAAAVIAYVGLIHAHPYVDGNGRLGRSIFNLLLQAYFNRDHFVPLQLMYQDRQPAFLLKLRRAMYGSDWLGILRLYASCAKWSALIQRPLLYD